MEEKAVLRIAYSNQKSQNLLKKPKKSLESATQNSRVSFGSTKVVSKVKELTCSYIIIIDTIGKQLIMNPTQIS